MSKLSQLIAELCPNGVEYKQFGHFVKIEKGKQLNKEFLHTIGKYPAYNGGISFSGYTDVYNYNENTIIVSQGGASAGFVNFVQTKFWANAHCYVILPKEELLNNRYAYHFLKLNQEKLMQNQHGAGIPALKPANIKCLSIPIPPISIQQEIVRILDSFTALSTELSTELVARKKQYQYYRDTLLTFDNNVPRVKLGEICEIERGNGLPKRDFVKEGIGCIHYGQIYTYYGLFADKTISFVSPDKASKLKKVYKGDIIVAVTSENIEDVCKCVVWLGDNYIVTGGHTAIIRHNQNPKFIAYWLQSREFYSQKTKIAQGIKVIEVTPFKLKNIIIPLPPLAEQQRIVDILDRFDTLVNNISIGIPAEIEARDKQYQYYRNKLLSFKRLKEEL